MGVTCDEYLILTSLGKKPLKRIKQHMKSLFKKEPDLKRYLSCVGKIGGGMNGHYSLVLLPSGWNGGYSHYQIMEKIKAKVEKINFKAEKFNALNEEKIKKNFKKNKHTVYWNILAFTDWGITFESDSEMDKECTPKLKWASNLKKGITPQSGDYTLDKDQFSALLELVLKDQKKKAISEKLKSQYLEQFGEEYKNSKIG